MQKNIGRVALSVSNMDDIEERCMTATEIFSRHIMDCVLLGLVRGHTEVKIRFDKLDMSVYLGEENVGGRALVERATDKDMMMALRLMHRIGAFVSWDPQHKTLTFDLSAPIIRAARGPVQRYGGVAELFM
jgi:hypothetical protein